LAFIDQLLEKEKVGNENAFDLAIENDIKSGKLDGLAAKAISDFKSINSKFRFIKIDKILKWIFQL